MSDDLQGTARRQELAERMATVLSRRIVEEPAAEPLLHRYLKKWILDKIQIEALNQKRPR